MQGHTGDVVSIVGSGRSPGGGNGNLPQYSCQENSMDRGAWQATAHWVSKNWPQLSTAHTHLSRLISNNVHHPRDSLFLTPVPHFHRGNYHLEFSHHRLILTVFYSHKCNFTVYMLLNKAYFNQQSFCVLYQWVNMFNFRYPNIISQYFPVWLALST